MNIHTNHQNDKFGSKFLKSQGYMAQLQQEYQIEYYDFSTDPEFIHDHRLFYDDDHLNLCGARLFSAKLNKIIY